jgi:hypothetical protein
MNELFAADPQCFERAADLKYLLGHFGPHSGRYLADYPVSWATDIVRNCESLGVVEAERIKALVRRARERSALVRKSGLPWQPGVGWFSNYKQVLAVRPGEFVSAVLPRSAEGMGVPTIDDLDLPPTAGEFIDAVASEYVRVSRTLLLISPELVITDPYLNPCKRDREEVLRAILQTAAKGQCRAITCWARVGEVADPRRNTWEEVCAAMDRILTAAAWPMDRSFKFFLVDDAVAKSKMHARYLFSIKGGIRYDQGLQSLPKGRRNEVTPIAVAIHDDLIRVFHEGEHDMSVERTYTWGTKR